MKLKLHIRNPDALAFVLVAYAIVLATGLLWYAGAPAWLLGSMGIGAFIFTVAGYRMGRD